MSDSESLNTAKDRIVAALRARSWARFRRECCPTIAIEEYWRLYPGFLDRKYRDIAETGRLFPRRNGSPSFENVASACGIRVDVREPPTPETLTAFRLFCDLVNFTAQEMPVWVRVEHEATGGEYRPLCGTAITGKVASNELWWIQLENHNGAWRVRRMVVNGH